ncbi:hypothetical protein Plhal304r1_c010g0040051 [Plasmopara halstedii]
MPQFTHPCSTFERRNNPNYRQQKHSEDLFAKNDVNDMLGVFLGTRRQPAPVCQWLLRNHARRRRRWKSYVAHSNTHQPRYIDSASVCLCKKVIDAMIQSISQIHTLNE